MSLIIDACGEYVYKDGIKVLKKSNHKVHQARVDLALPVGEWLFAPNKGHQLKKYQQENQTEETQEAFQKEAKLYLDKYGPEVTDFFVNRSGVRLDLKIKDEVSDV